MKTFLKSKLHFLIISLLSLTPIIWFFGMDGFLINGLDTNFPLDPLIWFKRRFFIWNSLVNGGQNFSSSVSGIFFHLIQVIPYLLGFNLQAVELISFIFWFSAICFSAYVFITSILPKKKLAAITFVVLYSFNIYLFNTWENIKVSNLALVVGLPLFLSILIRIKDGKISIGKFLVFTTLSSLLVSGSGINPAYFIVLIGSCVIYSLFAFLDLRGTQKKISFLIESFLFLTLVCLTNFFWLFPTVQHLLFSQKVVNLSDLGFTNWLYSLSENTSLLNVIRFQGAWDWYAKDISGMPLYIPYAANYFYRLPFVVFSFVLFAISLVSLILRQEKMRYIYAFFALLASLGIFFGVGSHPPTGEIYIFLIKHVPFLPFFRSPWYIFTPYVILSFSALAVLLYDYFDERTEGTRNYSKVLLWFCLATFFLGHMLYSYPLWMGKIFRSNRSDSFYVKFPDYLWDSARWLSESNQSDRLITYPDDQLEQFKWGYRGTDSITGLFSNKEFFTPTFNQGNKSIGLLMEKFYSHVKRQELGSAVSIMKFLGANVILNKTDALTLSPQLNESIEKITKTTTIGLWKFHEVPKDLTNQKIFVPRFVYTTDLEEEFVSATPLLESQSIQVKKGDTEFERTKLFNQAGNIILPKRFGNEENDLVNSTQKFTFEIAKTGRYKIGLERQGLRLSDVSMLIDENDITTGREEDAFFVWDIELTRAGNHEVEVVFPEYNNIFEKEDYSKYLVSDKLRKEEQPQNPMDTLVVYNDEDTEKLITFNLKAFNAMNDYVVSFDYKYFYGSVPILDIFQSIPRVPLKVLTVYPGSSSDWEKVTKFVDPAPIVGSDMEIKIRIPKNSMGARSKLYIENLSVNRAYTNKLILIPEEIPIIDSIPDVTYKKISPVEYEVEVKNISANYILAFLENYDTGWKILFGDETNKSIHFSINGYANAWFIPATQNSQKFKIYYQPQFYYNFSLAVSSITIFVSIVCWFKFGRTK